MSIIHRRPSEVRRAQSRLQASFDEITTRLGFADPKPKIQFQRMDDGSRHYERQPDGWDVVVTERGNEHERVKENSDEEALFRLSSDLTFGIAVQYELENRDENEDCRVKISEHQIELMGEVSQEWQQRVSDEWRKTLRLHPLHEKKRA